MAAKKNRTLTEHIRSQLRTADLSLGDMLKSRPVLSLDLDLVMQPLPNGLLRKRGAFEKFGETLGQRGLTAGDLDRALQSSNVRFIHDHPRYTTMVVRVNNPGGVTPNNGSCTVLDMGAKRQKAVMRADPPPKRIRGAERGPDSKTFGERLKACMAQRARQLGIGAEKYTQTQLIREATQVIGRDPRDEDQWVLSQQGLSLILTNQVSESPAAIAFALALGVEPAWLQYGIGPSNFAQKLLAK